MSKENKTKVKICGVKKVNKMSKEICVAELARLEKTNDASKYKRDVEARLAELS